MHTPGRQSSFETDMDLADGQCDSAQYRYQLWNSPWTRNIRPTTNGTSENGGVG